MDPFWPSSALAGYQQGQDWNSNLLTLISLLLLRYKAPLSTFLPSWVTFSAKIGHSCLDVTEDCTHSALSAKENGRFLNNPCTAAGLGGKTLSEDIRAKAITPTQVINNTAAPPISCHPAPSASDRGKPISNSEAPPRYQPMQGLYILQL